ncbi:MULTISPECIES: 16S rRNA (uracil(1498)-N(3))-methyltransferase [unclassified Frankia]
MVRRLRPGEPVDVTDGLGHAVECEVVAVRRDEIDCAVRRRAAAGAPSPRLVVVQALAKGDRGERAVEMLTEVGVDEIVPWSAARSVARWEDVRGVRARERWVRAAEEASKQSHRLHWPVVGELAGLKEVVERVRAAALAVVLHEEATIPLVGLARSVGLVRSVEVPERVGPTASAAELVLVVGPEGGVSEPELATLGEAGAIVSRLGLTVLRTSTAGVVAAAVVFADLGRWDGPAR